MLTAVPIWRPSAHLFIAASSTTHAAAPLAGPGWPTIVLAITLPAILSAILTPLVIRLAVRLGMLDRPNVRKIHRDPVPMLGGLAIGGAVLLSLPVIIVVAHLFTAGPDAQREVLALVLGGLVALAVGAIDEWRNLPPRLHFLGQIAAAGTAVLVLWFPHPTQMLGPLMLIGAGPNAASRATLLNPIFGLLHLHVSSAEIAQNSCGSACAPLQVLTIIFVLVWIVSMMNTVNFLDGIDGLAAGVVAIAAGVLALLASGISLPSTVGPEGADAILLPLVVAGAALGFLPFNWHPARIFMADTGAQFLGFALGLVALIGGAKLGTALIVLAVPVLDIAWAVVRRGMSFGVADRGHLHHRLLDLGLGHRRIVTLYYIPAILFGLASVILHDWRQKLALLIILVIVGVAAMFRLARASRR